MYGNTLQAFYKHCGRSSGCDSKAHLQFILVIWIHFNLSI